MKAALVLLSVILLKSMSYACPGAGQISLLDDEGNILASVNTYKATVTVSKDVRVQYLSAGNFTCDEDAYKKAYPAIYPPVPRPSMCSLFVDREIKAVQCEGQHEMIHKPEPFSNECKIVNNTYSFSQKLNEEGSALSVTLKQGNEEYSYQVEDVNFSPDQAHAKGGCGLAVNPR